MQAAAKIKNAHGSAINLSVSLIIRFGSAAILRVKTHDGERVLGEIPDDVFDSAGIRK